MKHIIAYIKPHKLSDVNLALHKIKELTGITVIDVRGCGRGKCITDRHSIEDDLIDHIPHVKIELFCPDELVEEIVSTIQTKAHTGLKGDGKIYITEAIDAIRISTGERGPNAV
ncbi:MAG: P-II family nitrogen regulator [Actinobacteria bacterium]|nr:P-II family nitrogen regulator [Actinomycetota bacterium]